MEGSKGTLFFVNKVWRKNDFNGVAHTNLYYQYLFLAMVGKVVTKIQDNLFKIRKQRKP